MVKNYSSSLNFNDFSVLSWIILSKEQIHKFNISHLTFVLYLYAMLFV